MGEVKAGLRVADAALVVVTAEKGVEVGTELTWQYADERNLPRMVLINKLDRENTSFDQALESLRKRFGLKVVPLQLPIGEQAGFKGVVDLVSQKGYTFEGGNKVQEVPIPADLKDKISSYREQLIESAVESDDTVMEKFLEGEELSDEEILSVIKMGTRSGQLIPVLCASTSKNIGVQALLDAIVDYMASAADSVPADVQAFNSNLSMFIFKTAAAQVGTISNFRVYSRTLKPDSHVFNVQTKADERIGQLITPRGKMQESATEIPAGDFGAVAKLSNSHTGDTLSGSKDTTTPLEPINFPEPVYTVAVFPRSKADLDKMSNALARVVEEDRTLRVSRDPETAEVHLSGMGESHIQIVEVDWLQGSGCIFAPAERVSRVRVGEFSHCPKVAGWNLCCAFLHFAARSNQLPNTLICLCLHVKDVAIWLERAAVDTEIADSTYLCRRSLKDEHRKVAIESLHVCLYRVHCAWHVIDDGVQERLYADIFAG